MSICPGCGGIVGRDCFNVQECIQISNSNNYDFYHLERENDELKCRIVDLEKLLFAHDIPIPPEKSYSQ